MAIRDAATLMRTAVDETIARLETAEADAAAVRLARYYADVLDAAETPKAREYAARWVGPLLLDCLEQLGATPAARARMQKGEPARHAEGRLTALRAARR